MELYGTRTVYRVGYEDDEIDDEFDVIKLDNNGSVTWSVKAVDGDSILNGSKVGKRLINFIKNK